MRKRDSKRRWKARYQRGQWITKEAVVNHRLEALVRDGEWHYAADLVRRQTFDLLVLNSERYYAPRPTRRAAC